MNRTLRIARIHTCNSLMLVLMPWGILAASFAGNVAIIAAFDDQLRSTYTTYGLMAIVIMMFLGFVGTMTEWLPFALGLGVTRTRFFTATVLVAVGTAVAYAVALLVLSAIEAGTDGWGLGLWFFAPAALGRDDPLRRFAVYAVVLLSAAALGLLIGIVHKRWGATGTFIASVLSIAATAGGIALVVWRGLWPSVGDWLTARSPVELWSGWLLLVGALIAGAYGLVRRVTP